MWCISTNPKAPVPRKPPQIFEIRARQTNPEKFAGDWLSAVPGPITQTQGGRDEGMKIIGWVHSFAMRSTTRPLIFPACMSSRTVLMSSSFRSSTVQWTRPSPAISSASFR
eukprot:EG_transcript_31496